MVGAYRRGAAYPQSIRVLVWHEGFERPDTESGLLELYRCLEREGIIGLEDMIAGGPKSPPTHTQLRGLARLDQARPFRHLHIRLVATESVPYRIFMDTGAGWLVNHMRQEAYKRYAMVQRRFSADGSGLLLWDGGMQPLGEEVSGPWPELTQFPPKTVILLDNERELFELLDVPWIEVSPTPAELTAAVGPRPQERTGAPPQVARVVVRVPRIRRLLKPRTLAGDGRQTRPRAPDQRVPDCRRLAPPHP